MVFAGVWCVLGRFRYSKRRLLCVVVRGNGSTPRLFGRLFCVSHIGLVFVLFGRVQLRLSLLTLESLFIKAVFPRPDILF